MTDITEEHSWKDEVEDLNQKIFRLNQELVASQLMTGLILQETGKVVVSRTKITEGLAGKQINLEDSEDGTAVFFSLVDTVE